jgi:putative NADH-flavin reductase
MRLLVLGATGGIGRAVVAQANARGHHVTAFVRSPQKMAASSTVLAIVEGDPRDASQLEKALPGCDAVVSTLGPPLPFTGRTTIMGGAAGATVQAMENAGVRRLVIISGDLQFPSGGPPWLLRATLLRHLVDDQAELERRTQASALDWTIVRPSRLTNGELTSAYRSEVGRMPAAAKAISRSDVAHFLVGAAESGGHVREIIGLTR